MDASKVLISVFIFAGVIWQIILAVKDTKKFPTRLIVPIIFSIFLFIGVLGFDVVSLYEDKTYYKFSNFRFSHLKLLDYEFSHFESSVKALVFGAVFVIKAYLGPIVLCGTSALVIHCASKNIELSTIPTLPSLFNWVFVGLPLWVKNIYIVILSIYIFTSSGYDAFR